MRSRKNQKFCFIMNPGSKGGSSIKQFGFIHKILNQNNIDYDYCITKDLKDAYDLSVQANKSGYDVIVAVGGDGTINRVLNGFYNKYGTRLSNAKFGVIYTGTSPDFCKSYNIPLDTEKALNTLLRGNTTLISIGKIEFEYDVKFFACCANIGLGATLAKNANSGIRKIFGDTLGTFLALIKTLFIYKPININLNGRSLTNVYNLSVGKTFYVASGLKIKNSLINADKRFYVLRIQDDIIKLMIKMYSGRDLDLDYKNEIKITGCGKVEFDGDEGGHLPCTITSAENLEVIYDGETTN